MNAVLAAPGAAALAAVLVCALMRRVAPALGLVDRPRMEPHKVQDRTIPYGGGTAVLTGLVAGVVVAIAVQPVLLSIPHSNPASDAGWHRLTWLGLGTLSMAVLGLYDDYRPLPPLWKLLLQTVVAAAVVTLGKVYITLFIPVRGVGMVLSVLWLVMITNMINLLDNHDGVAGGVSAIGCLFLGLLCLYNGEEAAAVILFGLAGALGGFLIHNFPPARIYLGDAGSLPVGFLIGGLSIVPAFYHGSGGAVPLAVLAPVFVLAVPLFDTARVFALRLMAGKPLLQPDRRHLSHRLLQLGYGPREVAGMHYLLALLTGSGAVLLSRVEWGGAFLLLAQVLGILVLVLVLERSGGAS